MSFAVRQDCSGSGPLFGVRPGDKLQVSEIGPHYRFNMGIKCKCEAEPWTAELRTAVGVAAGSIKVGHGEGQKSLEVPEPAR